MVLLLFLILFGMMLGAVLVLWTRPSEYRMLSEQIQHIQDRLSRTSISEQKGEVSDQPMPDAHVREKPRSVDNQQANNTKSTMQHTRQHDNGGFFRCRHLYPIFLDQSEDRFHLAYECCQEKCEQPSMVRKLLPCGVCKPIATVGVRHNLFFTKYGDKYHMGQCKHIQQSDHARVRGIPMCVECERSCMADR